MAREDTRRYDPILILDSEGRLLGKLTIQALLEPGIEANASETRPGLRDVSSADGHELQPWPIVA